MESHITASDAASAFPEMIERVHSQGEVFIVERAGEAVCRISPMAPPRRTVRDLVALLQAAARLNDTYFDAVKDVARNQPMIPETPWEQ